MLEHSNSLTPGMGLVRCLLVMVVVTLALMSMALQPVWLLFVPIRPCWKCSNWIRDKSHLGKKKKKEKEKGASIIFSKAENGIITESKQVEGAWSYLVPRLWRWPQAKCTRHVRRAAARCRTGCRASCDCSGSSPARSPTWPARTRPCTV